MEKTANLNARVSPIAKKRAEEVLKQLGIPMSTALEMYLNQIAMVGGIPFDVKLPRPPRAINANLMTPKELENKLRKGAESAKRGNIQRAEAAFAEHGEWFN